MVANRDLAKSKGLKQIDIQKIDSLHGVCEGLLYDMNHCETPNDTFFELLRKWRKNQERLQEMWGFEPNNAKWCEYKYIPFCTCPKMDNDDMGEHWVFNEDCPVHKQ